MTRIVRLSLVVVTSSILAASLAHGDATLQAEVEGRITVTENKTIFTLFCLLNLGGYDEENDPTGMHPVRVRARQQLASEVPPSVAKRIRDYYRQHKESSTYQYSVVAMSTSGPPDFRFTAEWQETKKDASFGSLEDLPICCASFMRRLPLRRFMRVSSPTTGHTSTRIGQQS